MSIFRRKGPNDEEVARENYIKRTITEALGIALKSLQQEYVCNEEYLPIQSEDTANNVCNIIEAIFLHGLKSSISIKLSNYLIGTDVARDPEPQFWEFLKKFTHRDVLAQLNHLGQVTTEIGLCRAWVRLALNDGLLESYIEAMLTDVSTLGNHYKRTAYLRDTEQPDIFKTYLHGLSNLQFQLSYNSSILNVWTVTPLVYAGLREAHVLPESTSLSHIAPTLEHEEVRYWSTEQINVLSDSTHVSNGQPLTSTHVDNPGSHEEEIPIVASKSHLRNQQTKVPPNTPHDSTLLTNRDVDYIRQLTADRRNKQDSGSSVTTDTSQISRPDSTDQREALWKSQTESQTISQTRVLDTTTDVHISHSDDDSLVMVDDHANDLETVDDSVNDIDSLAGRGVDLDSSYTSSADSEQSGASDTQEPVFLPDERDSTCATASSAGPSSVPASSAVRPVSTGRRLSLKISSVSSSPGSFTALSRPGPLTPILSDATATVSDLGKSRSCSQLKGVLESTASKLNIDPMMVSAEGSEISSVTDSSPVRSVSDEGGNYGNSLGAGSGWSSSFIDGQESKRLDMPDDISAQLLEASAEHTDILSNLEESIHADSFDTLLQSYGPTVSTQVAPSIKQVLDKFSDGSSPVRENLQSPTQSSSSADTNTEDTGFEILSLSTSVNTPVEDARLQAFKEVFNTICNERGLDAQNFQCKSCNRPVGMIYGKARVCKYDAYYYCYECHENEESLIPSRILYNWDFTRYKVCKYNYIQLIEYEEQPLVHIEKLNPLLYDHVPEMQQIKDLRIQLGFLRTYLFSCKQSVCEELRRMLWPREYLYEDIHLYSLQDLHHVYQSQLAPVLHKAIQFCTTHVYTCRLCSQKGFICEICQNPKVIYPFQTDSTHRCCSCRALYHAACKTKSATCPKCERRLKHRLVSSTDSCDYTFSSHP